MGSYFVYFLLILGTVVQVSFVPLWWNSYNHPLCTTETGSISHGMGHIGLNADLRYDINGMLISQFLNNKKNAEKSFSFYSL